MTNTRARRTGRNEPWFLVTGQTAVAWNLFQQLSIHRLAARRPPRVCTGAGCRSRVCPSSSGMQFTTPSMYIEASRLGMENGSARRADSE
jgi:hypothetical protein